MILDVLIPTASSSPYIEAALASVFRQQGVKAIYVIENNTGDVEYRKYLKDICFRYGAQYVLFEDRMPIFANWQRCMGIGTNEWVAFLHDDDIWNDRYLNHAVSVEQKSDLIFYEYAYFRDLKDVVNSPEVSTCLKCSNREDLLTKIVSTRFHLSSMLFRRCLRLRFSGDLRYYCDQNAILDCVQNHKNIRVSFISSSQPNLIRIHSNQDTFHSSVLTSAPKDDSTNYLLFARNVAEERLNLGEISRGITKYMNDGIVVRFLSMICFRRPLGINLKLAYWILQSKNSLALAARVLFHLLFQDLVRSVKNIIHRRAAK